MWLWLSLAWGDPVELDKAIAADEVVQVGSIEYRSDEPIYLLPTPIFDKLLTAEKAGRACEKGLSEVEEILVRTEGQRKEAQATAAIALARASEALQVAGDQMRADNVQAQDQVKLLLELEEKVGKAQAQRNVALAIAGGALSAVLVGAWAAR